MTKDYSVKITVRNARILRRMRELGIKTNTQLSKLSGLDQSRIGELINMRKAPLNVLTGGWTEPALALSSALRVDPEELWTVNQRTMSLRSNSEEISMSEEEVMQLMSSDHPDRLLGQRQGLLKALSTVDPRDRVCIERYYFDNDTMEDIGKDIGVGAARVQSLIRQGLRQLRHYKRRQYIEDYRYPDAED